MSSLKSKGCVGLVCCPSLQSTAPVLCFQHNTGDYTVWTGTNPPMIYITQSWINLFCMDVFEKCKSMAL